MLSGFIPPRCRMLVLLLGQSTAWLPFTWLLLKMEQMDVLPVSGCKIFDYRIETQGGHLELGTGR